MAIIISPYSRKLRNGKLNPKNYPYWKQLVQLVKETDNEVIQVGEGGEQPISGIDEFLACDMEVLKTRLESADLVISVDNFIPHMAHYYEIKCVVLWGQSDPRLFGYEENLNILRDEKYLRNNQFATWEEAEYDREAFADPEFVFNQIKHLL